MTYVKVDDRFPEHPKVLGVGPLAEALWLRALCYAGRNQTDGFIPAAFVFRMNDLDGEAAAEVLCDAGLWATTGAGWVIHDYPDWQTLKEDILAIGAKRAEAGSKGGKQKASNLLARGQDVASEVFKQTASKIYPEIEIEAETTPPFPPKGGSPPTTKPPQYSQEFEDTFWRHYPGGHGSKKAAYDRWRRLAPEDRSAAAAALPAWTASDHWQDGYIKNAETFLAQRMWESEPPAAKQPRAPNDPVPRSGKSVVHLAPAMAARMAAREEAT